MLSSNNRGCIFSSICRLAQHLWNGTQAVVNLGLDRYFRRKFQYNMPETSDSVLGMISTTVALAQATLPQWMKALSSLGRVWSAVVGTSFLLIPCAHLMHILNQHRSLIEFITQTLYRSSPDWIHWHSEIGTDPRHCNLFFRSCGASLKLNTKSWVCQFAQWKSTVTLAWSAYAFFVFFFFLVSVPRRVHLLFIIGI